MFGFNLNFGNHGQGQTNTNEQNANNQYRFPNNFMGPNLVNPFNGIFNGVNNQTRLAFIHFITLLLMIYFYYIF
jgi:hypothetical protein